MISGLWLLEPCWGEPNDWLPGLRTIHRPLLWGMFRHGARGSEDGAGRNGPEERGDYDPLCSNSRHGERCQRSAGGFGRVNGESLRVKGRVAFFGARGEEWPQAGWGWLEGGSRQLHSQNGKVNMMAELPSNVFLAEEFLEYFAAWQRK